MVRHLLVLPDGTEVFSGADADNAIQSVTLTECVNSETELYLGSVCAAMLEAKLITPEGGLSLDAGDEVDLYEVDEAGERAALGRFLLEKPTRPSANTMQLTAYDFVSRLDKDLTGWLSSLDGWPYRLDVFAGMVCEACGVEMAEGEIPNGDFLIQKFSGEGITGRQLMEWAAQAAGRFCRTSAAGEIEFAWYAPNPEAISSGGERFYYQGSLSYEDYAVAPIQRVRIQLTGDDVGVAWPGGDGETNTYSLTGNYLLTAGSSDTLLPIAKRLYETLKDFTYTPCKITVASGLGIRAGDILSVTDKNGHSFTTLVMTQTHTAGRDTLESTGSPRRDSAEVLNNTSIKSVTGRIFEVKKSLEGLSMAVSEIKSDLQGQIDRNSAAVNVLSDSIDSTVERYQQDVDGVNQQLSALRQTADGISISVQKIQEDGVGKVTTTGKQFTLDDSGLRIADPGGEMENLLDETGMYVKRGSTVMLQANEDGVIATDVRVHNYLVVDPHARFEGYSNGADERRMACFFL